MYLVLPSDSEFIAIMYIRKDTFINITDYIMYKVLYMKEYTTMRVKKINRDRLREHGKLGEDLDIALERLLNQLEEQMK